MLDANTFHFIEIFSHADLRAHPVWRHFEESRDREKILSWGVTQERLDHELEKFKFCGPDPLFPVLDLSDVSDVTGINVRVHFESPIGLRYDGYVIEPLAFGIFVGEREFCFNRSLPAAAGRRAEELSAIVAKPLSHLFPLHYAADLEFAEGCRVEGEIDRFW